MRLIPRVDGTRGDTLALLMPPFDAAFRIAILGPYCMCVGQVFAANIEAGETFSSTQVLVANSVDVGESAGQAFQPGIVAGQVFIVSEITTQEPIDEGVAIGQAFSPGIVAGQVANDCECP